MRWYQYIYKKPFTFSIYKLGIKNSKYFTSVNRNTKIPLIIDKDNIIGIGRINHRYNIIMTKGYIESTMYLKSYFDVRKGWIDITKKIKRDLILKNLNE